MFDLPSKSDIDKISYNLLKESKSLDVFPTPVDNIVQYANLKVSKDVDLSVINQSFIKKISDELANSYLTAIGLVRGFIDRREKTIYLDLKQGKSRQHFVKLHEVGHDVLYWQREILEHLDDDLSLNPDVQQEFEAEANYFASTTLFQHDRFDHEMNKLALEIKSPMYLARLFGASNHAAIRRYVETSKNRCALLVLEKITAMGQPPLCTRRNFFMSDPFAKTFGDVEFPEKFGFTWEFVKDYYFGKRFHENGEISLTTSNGTADFTYHFFNNNYNAFVFLFPIGETKSSKVKIIVPNP